MQGRRMGIRPALLLGLLVVIGISGLSGHWHRVASTDSSEPPLAAVAYPTVNANRLWTTLIELAQDRYREADRAKIRADLTAALESAGWATRQQPFSQTVEGQPYQGINIIAESPSSCATHSPYPSPDALRFPSIRGKDTPPPETDCLNAPFLLIGAHYDAVPGSPGADDNATGMAALLEVAQLFSPRTTSLPLKLVFFDGEEAGLWGSQAFAADAAETEEVSGAIILEMLGYRCQVEGCQQYPPLPVSPPTQIGDFLAVVGDRAHPQLTQAFQQSASTLPIYTLSIPTVAGLAPDLIRSDHVSFWRQGIGAVMVTDTANFRNPHYHQESDRPDTLDREFFTAATQTIVNVVAQLTHSASSPPL